MPAYASGGGLGVQAEMLLGHMNLLQALRTGSPVLDVLVAMMLPVTFKLAYSMGAWVWPILVSSARSFFASDATWPSKTITVERSLNDFGSRAFSQTENKRNHILAKALELYISSSHVPIDLSQESEVSLIAVKEVVGGGKPHRYDSMGMNYGYPSPFGSTHQALESYTITQAPVQGKWAKLNVDRIELKVTVKTVSAGGGFDEDSPFRPPPKDGAMVMKTSYTLRGPNEKRIETFLQHAFDWYKKEMKAKQTQGRFLFTLIRPVDASSAGKPLRPGPGGAPIIERPIYAKHRLADNGKTFDSLFIPNKDEFLRLVANFAAKQGKYTIPGVQHKLGLLLCGKPGTGKTSLIKALAHHTKRHIVSIPLSRLKTNRELHDMMFDLTFPCVGDDEDEKFAFDQIIFTIEDCDAASSVVMQRSNDTAAHLVPAPAAPAAASISVASDGVISKVAVKDAPVDDALNLAGLLNVIDGVVDTPGRILILTSNHPEKLDAALTRPGRVDRIITLGDVQLKEAQAMTAHYFSLARLPASAEAVLGDIFGAGECCLSLTPAELENMLMAAETLEEFLEYLCANRRRLSVGKLVSTNRTNGDRAAAVEN